jgi:Tfp pilus assembly protein PilP
MRPPDHAVFVRVGVVLIALISSGCEQTGMGELRAYVREINSRPPGAVEPLPEIQPVDSFVFDPAGRRDPFVMDGPSKDAAKSNNRLAPDPNRPKEQLEGFPLAALTMVGTLQQDDRRWALVQTKHRTRPGVSRWRWKLHGTQQRTNSRYRHRFHQDHGDRLGRSRRMARESDNDSSPRMTGRGKPR